MRRQPETELVAEPERRMGGPRSLTRILGLFEVLSGTNAGMSLTELSETLGSPKSSLLHLLRPLVSEGYLTHENGIYRLGASLYRLAAGVLANWDFPRLVRPFMAELAQRTGETALLGVLNREAESLTYVEIIDGPHPIRYHIPVGTTRTLYASAAGRLLLAYADRDWCRSYLASVIFKVRTAAPMTRDPCARTLPDGSGSENAASRLSEIFSAKARLTSPQTESIENALRMALEIPSCSDFSARRMVKGSKETSFFGRPPVFHSKHSQVNMVAGMRDAECGEDAIRRPPGHRGSPTRRIRGARQRAR